MSDSTRRRDPARLRAGLLGPAEPEVSCEECFDRLDHYVELVVEGRDADRAVPGMRVHLQGCPACRDDYESLRDFISGKGS